MLIDLSGVKEKEKKAKPTTVIPDGEYLAVIEKSENKNTKDFSGKYLNVMWKITEGPFKNRTIWIKYHYENKSSAAVEMGKKALAKILSVNEKGTGIKDETTLLGLTAVITVGSKNHEKFGDENTIEGYAPAERVLDFDVPHQGKSSSVPGL